MKKTRILMILLCAIPMITLGLSGCDNPNNSSSTKNDEVLGENEVIKEFPCDLGFRIKFKHPAEKIDYKELKISLDGKQAFYKWYDPKTSYKEKIKDDTFEYPFVEAGKTYTVKVEFNGTAYRTISITPKTGLGELYVKNSSELEFVTNTDNKYQIKLNKEPELSCSEATPEGVYFSWSGDTIDYTGDYFAFEDCTKKWINLRKGDTEKEKIKDMDDENEFTFWWSISCKYNNHNYIIYNDETKLNFPKPADFTSVAGTYKGSIKDKFNFTLESTIDNWGNSSVIIGPPDHPDDQGIITGYCLWKEENTKVIFYASKREGNDNYTAWGTDEFEFSFSDGKMTGKFEGVDFTMTKQ